MMIQNPASWADTSAKAELEIHHHLFDFLELKFPPKVKQDDSETRFREAVRKAAVAAGGELLFDLPADGLIDNRRRIALARIPDDGAKTRFVMAALDQDNARIHIETPDARTLHLIGFAEAFVGVLHHIAGTAPSAAISSNLTQRATFSVRAADLGHNPISAYRPRKVA